MGNWPRRCCLKDFFIYIFNSGGHFVQQSGIIFAILVKEHTRNISVKLSLNPANCQGGEVVQRFSSIFSSGGHFVQPTKTCLYNTDPLKPHFYIVKLGFTEVDIIFLISA